MVGSRKWVDGSGLRDLRFYIVEPVEWVYLGCFIIMYE